MKQSAPRVRLVFGALIYLLLVGCANQLVESPTAFPVLKNTQNYSVVDVDVLAVSDEMKAFVKRHLKGHGSSRQKLMTLVQAIMHPGVLGFEYDPEQTYTAQEAFNRRTGNCLAFSNLFVALAREAGLKASYQEAQVAPEWNFEENALLLAKHINVLVRLKSGNYVVDVGRKAVGETFDVEVRGDNNAEAHYYNNLGVDALLGENLAQAHGYFKRALEIAPDAEFIWSNLGVTYNRNGQPDEAMWAYHQALSVNRRALTAMSNLSSVYTEQGNHAKANELYQKVERYRQENPYYLLMLSNKAVSETRYQDAIKLLRKAIRKKETEHRLHFALARSFYLSGRIDQAKTSFERAKQLAPNSELRKTYSKELDKLI